MSKPWEMEAPLARPTLGGVTYSRSTWRRFEQMRSVHGGAAILAAAAPDVAGHQPIGHRSHKHRSLPPLQFAVLQMPGHPRSNAARNSFFPGQTILPGDTEPQAPRCLYVPPTLKAP